jgi:opacity protein-like surface antigen
MLRVLIVASLLVLVSATSVQADSSAAREEGVTVQIRFGARVGSGVGSAQAFVQPAVRTTMPSVAMYRMINGVAQVQQRSDGRHGMLGLVAMGGDQPALALPVSDSVSLGVGYEYLRREDIHLEVAETGSLSEAYSTHNLTVRAHWKF